ncbi:MAG: hypothetical protein IR160_11955 [Salinibacterium sp.]|nr:SipW-dependent-type signal peptide-containing protein [Salinibacterium sp.]MBF0673285.1 hypothetical protein [Salinibacterium sp.]
MRENSPATSAATASDPDRRHRSRPLALRVRAILAAGLVLGAGTAVTLAAWSDSEFASGTFASGSELTLVGSTDGVRFSASSGAPGHSLAFSADVAGIAPDETIHAPFHLALAEGATGTGTAELTVASVESSDTAGSNSEHLAWAFYELPDGAGCDAAAIMGLTPLASAPTLASAASVASGSVTLVGTEPVSLCASVTAGSQADGFESAASTTATWQFSAASE